MRARLVVVLVVAVVVVALVAAVWSSHRHKSAAPNAAPAASSTTRPVTRTTVRASSSTAPITTSLPTITLPTITLPPPFTSDQLTLALLQSGDLPAEARRDLVAPNAWGGVCGSSPPAFAAPISAAAVDFNGPRACTSARTSPTTAVIPPATSTPCGPRSHAPRTLSDGTPGSPAITVVPIPPAEVAGGIDTRNGAVGLAVKTVDARGRASFHVWLRQGNLVISVQDDALTANAVSAVQLTQLALERVKNTLA